MTKELILTLPLKYLEECVDTKYTKKQLILLLLDAWGWQPVNNSWKDVKTK